MFRRTGCAPPPGRSRSPDDRAIEAATEPVEGDPSSSGDHSLRIVDEVGDELDVLTLADHGERAYGSRPNSRHVVGRAADELRHRVGELTVAPSRR